MCRQISRLVLLLLCAVGPTVVADDAPDLQLTLPPAIYAVPGVELDVYFDDVVLTQELQAYRFEVDCPLGKAADDRWTLDAAGVETGDYAFSIRVRSSEGALLASAESVLNIVSPQAGADAKLRLLIVGDSLTNATVYPNELARLLSQPGNPQCTMLGTHRPSNAATGVAHEGYGGWTWELFSGKYEPNPDEAKRLRSSPFVFVGDEGKPGLDVPRYIREQCDGDPPDFVIFLLGINDCFGAPPYDPQGIDARIDHMFDQANILLADFRKAAPDAQFGICLTPAPNSREEAFAANYKGAYTRWGWKRIQHRLVQRQIAQFHNGDDPRVSVIPTELCIDPVNGYPEDNSVHPNTTGYQQLATTIYAWLKSRL